MSSAPLAEWAVNLKYEQLPEEVVHAAVRTFYNWAGCAIGGSNHEAATITREALTPFMGPSTSTVMGHKGEVRVDAQHAALINGIASHVHDFDDTHLKTIIHPAGPVCSALLAYAEWKPPVSGADFILAMVAGIEVACTLGLAVNPAHFDLGWHLTGSTGSMAAAVAVGKLMKLDVQAMRNAIGVAASQVIGLQSQLGSHTKSFHPGRAAQCGLLAALLASKGFTSSAHALEAKNGWLHAVTTSHDFPCRVGFLGKNWEIVENAFKPYACGIVCHPLIDGCVQLHHELAKMGLKLSEIRSVDAIVHPLAVKVTGARQPETGLQGKFSVYHSGAAGLAFGKAGILQYTDAVVKETQVVELREKIHTTTDADLGRDEAVLTLTLNDSKVLKKHVIHAVGSIDVPMTDGQLTEKFKDQTSLVLNDMQLVDQASEACWKLRQVPDMTQITSLL